MIEILGPEDGTKMAKIFGFSDNGNFRDEATGQSTGMNIPHLPRSKDELAKKSGMSLDEFDGFVEMSRQQLFDVREKRIHPLKDDKILTDWNGLMIAALSLGGQVLNEPDYITAAERAAKFIEKNLRDKKERLMKRYRLGKAGLSPHLDDYSFMVWGLLNLYEATFDTEYLARAIKLTDIMNLSLIHI